MARMSLASWEMSVSPFRELVRVALVHGSEILSAVGPPLLTLVSIAWLCAVLFCAFRMRVAHLRLRRELMSLRGPDGKARSIDLRLLWRVLGWLAVFAVVGAAGYPLTYLIRWSGL